MDVREAWLLCLRHIKLNIDPEGYEKWFRGTLAGRFDRDHLVVEAPSPVHSNFLSCQYAWLVEKVVHEAFGWNPSIEFRSARGVTPIQIPIGFQESVPAERHQDLNFRYRFDNFAVGESNEIACSAARAVAESPGKAALNPLVIHSEVGLGKTHLLQAIGNFASENGTAKKIVYTTAERFFTEFLRGIEKRNTKPFHETYRTADILLIDDIQFYIRTEACQRELLHTFNVLHQADKQIVITSDQPPSSLNGFENRLISRFLSGAALEIKPPGLDTRVDILIQKAVDLGIQLDSDVARVIARKYETNGRELEGALKRLGVISQSRGSAICPDLVRQSLPGRQNATPKTFQIDRIQELTAEFFDLSLKEIRSKSRQGAIAHARHVGMYVIRTLTEASLKEIGLHFERDHSTVIHACKTIEKKLTTNLEFKERIDVLIQTIHEDVA